MISGETKQEVKNEPVFPQQRLEEDYLDCLLGIDSGGDELLLDEQNNQSDEKPEFTEGLIGKEKDGCEADCGNPEPEQCSEKSNAGNADRLTEIDGDVTERMTIDELRNSNTPFVCQLIRLRGVRFALPLSGYSRVVAVPDDIEINSNTESCCCAKFKWQDKNAFLIAMEKIVFPESMINIDKILEADTKKRIVLLEEDNVGFLCDEVLETVSVKPDDVTWRDSASNRMWLGGLVKQDGFAILDLKGMLMSVVK